MSFIKRMTTPKPKPEAMDKMCSRIEAKLSAVEKKNQSLQKQADELSRELADAKQELEHLRAAVVSAPSPGNVQGQDSSVDHPPPQGKPPEQSTKPDQGAKKEAKDLAKDDGAPSLRNRQEPGPSDDGHLPQREPRTRPNVDPGQGTSAPRQGNASAVVAVGGGAGASGTERADQQDQLSLLRREIATLRDDNIKLQNAIDALHANQARKDPPSKLVAFHAKLQSPLRTKTATTLICDNIATNLSNSYDSTTGVFTCPVAGTYCFLATSSPNDLDDNKEAALDIVVDDKVMGGLCSYGYRWSTGHCVVKLKAGQRVWLRTVDGEHSFAGNWWTTFSGMLLQPEK